MREEGRRIEVRGTIQGVGSMCDACRLEYETPASRRFHAQPNTCPDCGPRLRVLGPTGASVSQKDPIAMAGRAIRCHLIVAVNGLGGFHLACDATSSMAVKRLRERRGHDEKPFAVMVPDLETAERAVFLSREHKELLCSSSRPIVLAKRNPDGMLCEEIAPDSHLVGLMLPHTALHRLLLAEFGSPLVMTPGSLSGEESIVRSNDEAVDRFGEIADIFLVDDREVGSGSDDSELNH